MPTVVISHHYNNAASEAYVQEVDTATSSYVGKEGEVFFDPTTTTLRISDGSTAGGNVVSGAIATGFINMNGDNPTWTGTSGYTVSKSGGDGSAQDVDVVYTLTFPSAYAARTDYIVHATYDGTNWTAGNGVEIGTTRFTDRVEFIIRRWNEDPLNLGEIMVTIHNL